jgi:hypothetical protein
MRARATHIFDRDPGDHYVEPRWCSSRLFDCEPFEGAIVDPCCGFGYIPDSANAHGYQTEARDVVDRGYPGTIVADFLQADASSIDNIVMNSPYKGHRGGLLKTFVTQAVEVSRRKVAAFVPLARLNAAWPWLRPLPLTRVWLLQPRPSCPPGWYITKGKKPKGGRPDYCWLIFDRGHNGTPAFGWLTRDGGPGDL